MHLTNIYGPVLEDYFFLVRRCAPLTEMIMAAVVKGEMCNMRVCQIMA